MCNKDYVRVREMERERGGVKNQTQFGKNRKKEKSENKNSREKKQHSFATVCVN